MNFSLFIGDKSKPMFYSLERYFKYKLNRKLVYSRSPFLNTAKNLSLIFSLNDPESLAKCCQLIYDNRICSDKLRIIGYDSFNDINMVDVYTLTSQVENCFQIRQVIDRMKIPFFRDHIELFFKGHGEQSLLECLTWVSYYLGNYPNLAKSGDYTPEELYQNFLLSGIQSWNEFIRRFSKYAPILYAAGWIIESESIERYFKIISADIKNAGMSDSFHIFGIDSLSSLSEISILMEDMARQSDQSYEETNPFDNR